MAILASSGQITIVTTHYSRTAPLYLIQETTVVMWAAKGNLGVILENFCLVGIIVKFHCAVSVAYLLIA